MKLKFTFFIIFALILSLSIQAQTNPATDYSKLTAKDYADLLATLKGGDTNIDFTALRMAFTKTKDYSYSGPDKKDREPLYKQFSDKKYKDALKTAEKYLEKNYVDANGHFIAYNSAKELKDDKKAEFYKAVVLGLLKSIQNGNDGSSAKTPFSVITIDEEYTLIKFLGYQRGSQSLQHLDGHTFDVLEVTGAKTNEKKTFYFNIDVVWKAETEIFGK
jgi:hypothetical protein